MDTYALAEVGERQGMIWLSCTNAQEAKAILSELQQHFPEWRVRPRKTYTYHSGDETGWKIDKCEGRHRYGQWWLIRKLCDRAWEPIAVAPEGVLPKWLP